MPVCAHHTQANARLDDPSHPGKLLTARKARLGDNPTIRRNSCHGAFGNSVLIPKSTNVWIVALSCITGIVLMRHTSLNFPLLTLKECALYGIMTPSLYTERWGPVLSQGLCTWHLLPLKQNSLFKHMVSGLSNVILFYICRCRVCMRRCLDSMKALSLLLTA